MTDRNHCSHLVIGGCQPCRMGNGRTVQKDAWLAEHKAHGGMAEEDTKWTHLIFLVCLCGHRLLVKDERTR